MKASLFSPLLILQLLATKSSSSFRLQDVSEVPFGSFSGLSYVSVVLDGKPRAMLVDSGSRGTFLFSKNASEVALPTSTRILVGNAVFLANVGQRYMPNLQKNLGDAEGGGHCPVDGILGVDFLSTVSVGFDYIAHTIKFWRRGSLTMTEAQEWVKASTPWPNLQLELSPRIIPLSKDVIHYWGFSTSLDGKGAVHYVLDTGNTTPTILDSKVPDDSTLVRNTLTFGVRRIATREYLWLAPNKPDLMSRWMKFQECKPADYPEIAAVADGIIGPMSLNSRRVLCDFSGAKLYLEPVDDEMALSLSLSNALDCPLRISGSHIFYGPVPNVGTISNSKQWEGWELQKINGLTPRQLISILSTYDQKARSSLARLIRSREINGLTLNVGTTTENQDLIFRGVLGIP